MNDSKLGTILVIFIALIIGVTLVSTLADNIHSSTNLVTKSADSIVITADAGTVPVVGNGLGVVVTGFYNSTISGVIGTSVNYTSAGAIIVQNYTFDDGTYLVNYTYQPVGYVNNGTARTFLGLIILFFVIAIVIYASRNAKDLIEQFK